VRSTASTSLPLQRFRGATASFPERRKPSACERGLCRSGGHRTETPLAGDGPSLCSRSSRRMSDGIRYCIRAPVFGSSRMARSVCIVEAHRGSIYVLDPSLNL
jgi:hypothetical protein